MIYAIEAVGSGAVKIGFADDLASRIVGIETGCPFALEVRGQCEGGFREEALFHKLFAKQRIRREWYSADTLGEFKRIADSADPRHELESAWARALQAMRERHLSEQEARRLLASGLRQPCVDFGPSRVARIAGCDEKTIRRARDEDSTLGLACHWNLLDVDQHALDALAGSKGYMLVPLIAKGATDIIPSAGAAIHAIGNNRAEHSDGGAAETDRELVASETQNDALLASVLDRRARIVEAKLRLARARAA